MKSKITIELKEDGIYKAFLSHAESYSSIIIAQGAHYEDCLKKATNYALELVTSIPKQKSEQVLIAEQRFDDNIKKQIIELKKQRKEF